MKGFCCSFYLAWVAGVKRGQLLTGYRKADGIGRRMEEGGNDKGVTSSKKKSQLKTRGQKSIPHLWLKRLKNHTLWGRTCLYLPYKGVPPPGENLPAALMRFLYNRFWVVENLCAVFKLIFAEKKLFNTAQVAITKMPRNEAKIYQETVFLRALKDIYWLPLVTSWLKLLHWTLYRLHWRLSHFVCELSYLISKLCSFAKVECLHLSS